MRRSRHRYWIASVGIGGVAVGTLVITALAAVGGTPSDAKHQLLGHPHALASLPAGSGTYVYQPPRARPSTSGRQALAATQSAEADAISRAISLLTSYYQLQVLPSDVAQRPAAITAGQQGRATQMRALWSGDVVDSRIADLENALNLVANDETYQAYSDCTIIADQTTATATVTDLTASVVFTGHAHYTVGATTKDDPDTQWQVQLSRSATDQDWLLIGFGQVSLSGSDS